MASRSHREGEGLDSSSGSSTDRNLWFERSLDRYAGAPLVHGLSALLRVVPRATPPQGGAVRRMLLIKFYGIGNIVMLLPAVRALHARFPSAEIHFLTLLSNAGILAGTEEVARLHFLDKRNAGTFVLSALRALPTLRALSFDLIVDFEQFANVSAILTALIGAPWTVGFNNPANCRSKLYTTPVPYLDTMHMSRTFLRLAKAAGAEAAAEVSRDIPLAPEDVREAVALERTAGIGPDEVIVLMHPGSSENLVLRRWPVERFAELADQLIRRHGVRVVITGGPAELALAERLRGLIRGGAVDAAGKLSLKGLTAMCRRSELLVSNDTGPVHVASAVGTPVVGIYGPNTPFLYGPLGADDLVYYRELSCSPCLVNVTLKISRCRHARCVEDVGVAEVADGISRTYFETDGSLKPRFKKNRASEP